MNTQPPSAPTSAAGETAASKAATKASAYGGSEAGALVGGAVGPPIIGTTSICKKHFKRDMQRFQLVTLNPSSYRVFSQVRYHIKIFRYIKGNFHEALFLPQFSINLLF